MKKKMMSAITALVTLSMMCSALVTSPSETKTTNFPTSNPVHVMKMSDINWPSSGEMAGSTDSMPSFSGVRIKAYAASSTPDIQVQAHVQDKGWLSVVKGGNTAGTVGEGLRLEDLKLKLTNAPSSGIKISTHQADVGWVSYKAASNDKWVESGTTGQNKAIQGFKLQLTGSLASQYDVYYRSHVAHVGWLGWAKNGEVSGSTGIGLQAEAVQIKLVKKGASFNRGGTAYLTKPSLTYRVHVQDIGTMSYVKEGETGGTVGRELRMEAVWAKFIGFDGKSGISVRSHVSNVGWQDWVSSGKMSGTTRQNNSIECVQMNLSPLMSNIFDIYYRVHVQNIGWMGWACNGESAGTTGGGLRAEAIQIVIVNKNAPFDAGGASYQDKTPQPTREAVAFQQTDSKWRNHPYGYSNTAGTQRAYIGKGGGGDFGSGCGILAFTNSVYYLNEQFIDPVTLADWSVANGYRVNGIGTSHGLYPAYIKNYGSKYGISYAGKTSSYTSLRNHLLSGGTAVAAATGHLMAVVDYNPTTKQYLILDSAASSSRLTQNGGCAWVTESQIKNTSKLNFSSFMLISKA